MDSTKWTHAHHYTQQRMFSTPRHPSLSHHPNPKGTCCLTFNSVSMPLVSCFCGFRSWDLFCVWLLRPSIVLQSAIHSVAFGCGAFVHIVGQHFILWIDTEIVFSCNEKYHCVHFHTHSCAHIDAGCCMSTDRYGHFSHNSSYYIYILINKFGALYQNMV